MAPAPFTATILAGTDIPGTDTVSSGPVAIASR